MQWKTMIGYGSAIGIYDTDIEQPWITNDNKLYELLVSM